MESVVLNWVISILPAPTYIAVTDVPEHVMPNQDWPHGSPPFAIQPVSWLGELREAYSTLREETGTIQYMTNGEESVSFLYYNKEIHKQLPLSCNHVNH